MHDKRLVLSLTNEGGNLLSSIKGHSLGRNFVGNSVARSVTISRPGLPLHRPRQGYSRYATDGLGTEACGRSTRCGPAGLSFLRCFVADRSNRLGFAAVPLLSEWPTSRADASGRPCHRLTRTVVGSDSERR